MKDMQIGGVYIGSHHRPFIIAEMSGNHNHSLERALEITEKAAASGVQALKLQTYTPDTLTLDIKTEQFMLMEKDSLWKGESLYELFKRAHTPWEWHKPIMARAKELGIMCFSSPFDETAVEFLETLNVPAYKIASFEITHLPLIRAAAATRKPLIMSTAMASEEEIKEAVAEARKAGCIDIVLLKCTSAYPAQAKDANILTIPDMRKKFGCEVGLSDHTLGIGVATAAVAHGAVVVEKHFTLNRADGGPDAAFSLEPNEMKELVVETERAWQSLGHVSYGATASEKASLQERRSLYIASDMKAGDVLTKGNLRCIRPSYGLPPKFYDVLLGKKVLRDVKKGTPVDWTLVDAKPTR
ncbi:MAG: pseudaminic acid synthase [bacterium]|nr:pseudaminic acid synthase [bacterium]